MSRALIGGVVAVVIVVLTGTFAQTMMKLSTGRLGAFEGGSLFHYLVRGENSCGAGGLGTDTAGQPRNAPACAD